MCAIGRPDSKTIRVPRSNSSSGYFLFPGDRVPFRQIGVAVKPGPAQLDFAASWGDRALLSPATRASKRPGTSPSRLLDCARASS
jgi:hypothetical protein